MRRQALLLGISSYADKTLGQLVASRADIAQLEIVLADPAIGGFDDVRKVGDCSSQEFREHVEQFYSEGEPDELLLLYISGHGVKDRDGRLYFAASNTKINLLRATGVPATFIEEVASASRSRCQVMLLDTCFSGAFARGHVHKSAGKIAPEELLGGDPTGRVVITASDRMQYAFAEGGTQGEATPSAFTRHVIKGLQSGAADFDRDGRVSVDDLYRYVREQIRQEGLGQQPQKWAFGSTGDIVLARNPNVAPAKLPEELLELIRHSRSDLREIAVRDLAALLQSDSPGQRLAATRQLQHLANDDSKRVSALAAQALASVENRSTSAASNQNTLGETERAQQETTPHGVPLHGVLRSISQGTSSRRGFLTAAVIGLIVLGYSLWHFWPSQEPQSQTPPVESRHRPSTLASVDNPHEPTVAVSVDQNSTKPPLDESSAAPELKTSEPTANTVKPKRPASHLRPKTEDPRGKDLTSNGVPPPTPAQIASLQRQLATRDDPDLARKGTPPQETVGRSCTCTMPEYSRSQCHASVSGNSTLRIQSSSQACSIVGVRVGNAVRYFQFLGGAYETRLGQGSEDAEAVSCVACPN